MFTAAASPSSTSMASTVRRAFRCLLEGLRSLPPRRRRAGAGGGAARRSSKAAPRVVVIRRFSGKLDRRRASASGGPPTPPAAAAAAPVTIRVATFNAAMFSMAPAVPSPPDHDDYDGDGEGCSTWRAPASSSSGSRLARRPKKGILKAQSRSSAPPPPPSPDVELLRRRRHVSISLPDDDDEIAPHHRRNSSSSSSSASARLVTRPAAATSGSGRWRSVFGAVWEHQNHYQQRRQKQKQKQEREQATARHRSSSGAARRRSVAEALREAGADMVALQNVRAEEGRGMRPLSELAEGLGMRYVFAESWAPEYGNAVLSRWPIKRWNARRLADHFDFRYVRHTRDIRQIVITTHAMAATMRAYICCLTSFESRISFSRTRKRIARRYISRKQYRIMHIIGIAVITSSHILITLHYTCALTYMPSKVPNNYEILTFGKKINDYRLCCY